MWDRPKQDLVLRMFGKACLGGHSNIVQHLFGLYPSFPVSDSLILAAVHSRSTELFEILISKDPSIINKDLGISGSAITVSSLSGALLVFVVCS